MKKYSSIKKANSRRILLTKRIIFVALTAVLLLFCLYVAPVLVRGVVAVVWYPFESARLWVAESGSSLPQYLRERGELLSELEALKVTNALDQGTENTIRKLQVENNELRTRSGAVPEDRLLARVVGRPNQLPYDMLMLDRGAQHGVVLQAPVFLGTDQVIGFVSKVNEKTSLVTLITTAGFTASAYVLGPNIYTYAEGMGGGVLRVRVPQGILLQVGDLVVFPAIDSGVYGEVSSVETAPTQPEQHGYVSTSIPLQSLYYVSIGREPMVTHTYADAEAVIQDVTSKLFVVDLPPGVLVTPEVATSTVSSTAPVLPPPVVATTSSSTQN